jgi:hypothetical protein
MSARPLLTRTTVLRSDLRKGDWGQGQGRSWIERAVGGPQGCLARVEESASGLPSATERVLARVDATRRPPDRRAGRTHARAPPARRRPPRHRRATRERLRQRGEGAGAHDRRAGRASAPLEEAPDGLPELRGTILREREWRVRERARIRDSSPNVRTSLGPVFRRVREREGLGIPLLREKRSRRHDDD